MINISFLKKTRQLNIDPVVLLALGFVISISYIFIFNSTICSRIITLLYNRITTLLYSRISTLPCSRILLCIFSLPFRLLISFKLGLCNPNTSRRCNFVAYIKAPCIHFFLQWRWIMKIYYSLCELVMDLESSF